MAVSAQLECCLGWFGWGTVDRGPPNRAGPCQFKESDMFPWWLGATPPGVAAKYPLPQQFTDAVRVSSWNATFLALNGLSMEGMLIALGSLPPSFRDQLLSLRGSQ